MRHAFQVLASLVTLAALATTATSQTVFHALLTGDQTGTPSTATATGVVYLDQGTQTLSYTVEVGGLSGPVTAAHIHKGPADGFGDPWLDLTGGPDLWAGTSPVLTATEVQELQTSNMHFVFHTALYVTGEIRGQITPSLTQFDALLDGAQVVPASGSVATASAAFTLNPDFSLTYSLTVSGLEGTGPVVRVYKGLPGQTGPLVLTLSGGPTTWAGATAPLTGKPFAYLSSGLLHVQVHSLLYPDGEVRGQIVPSFTPYGSGCPGPSGLMELPVGGGSCTLYVGPTVPIVVPLGLGPSGSLVLPALLPPTTPAPLWVQLQFFELNPAAPNGKFFATNGLGMHVND